MALQARIRVEQADGVRVVRFLDRQLYDDRTVREVADQLFQLLPIAGQNPRLILDFTGVDSVSSGMLGKLILLQRRVDAAEGRLVLCELGESIQSILSTTNLDRLFQVVRDRREALANLGQAPTS